MKLKGKDVYDVNIEEGKYTEEFTGFIKVPMTSLREGYAAPTRTKAVKKVPKQVAPQTVREESKYAAQVKKILSGADILAKYNK